MNPGESRCSCGEPIQAGESVCPKCLLAAGLGETTAFPADSAASSDLAETRAASDAAVARTAANDIWDRDDDQDTIVSGYRHLEALHDWSGGTVFKAYHRGLDRQVRLRVLQASADDATRNEFLSRAEKLSKINHPNTIAILEAGVDDGSAFVAEEYVEGNSIACFQPRSWRERWREGFFPGAELARAMRDAALGLQAIHEAGLVHGHLNDESLLVDGNATVRVIGLESPADTRDDRFASPAGPRIDQTVAGDIHRLAAIFFFLTTRMMPVDVDRTLDPETLGRRMRKANCGLSRDFCELVAGCLDADARTYRTAGEVVEALDRIQERRVSNAPQRGRTNSLLLEGFALLFLVSLFITVLSSNRTIDSGLPGLLLLIVPSIYMTLLETGLGWTPARRMFGYRLLNHAGDPFSPLQRLVRVALKLGLVAIVLTFPEVVAAMASLRKSDTDALLFVTPGFTVVALILYSLQSRSKASRWTLYDMLAGVSWGEETFVAGDTATTKAGEESSPPTAELIDRVDQYEIYEPLGEGGMGKVFRAHDRVLGRDVALKTLVGQFTDDPVLLNRFQREARLAAKISHNNVAKVYGAGIWRDSPYISMELIDGRNLQQIVRDQGAIPVAVAWRYIISAAEALSAADQSGVVHRDIKPANLMVTSDGQLKVTDFGVSRQTSVDHSVTEAGMIVGTPAYMPPEQAMGKEVDCRCDIYALGMTLYHMLAGQPPFQGSNVMEILAQQMEASPPSLLDQIDGLTPAQNAVLLKMIAKRPDERYGSYEDLLSALRQCAPNYDRQASPAKRIAAELCNFATCYLVFTFSVFIMFAFGRELGMSQQNGTPIVGWFVAALFAIFSGVYIYMTGRYGATPGKNLLGLQVTRTDGGAIGYGASCVRYLVAYPALWMLIPMSAYSVINRIPFPYFSYVNDVVIGIQGVLLIASLLMLWLHPGGRTVHDLAAGTIVVRRVLT